MCSTVVSYLWRSSLLVAVVVMVVFGGTPRAQAQDPIDLSEIRGAQSGDFLRGRLIVAPTAQALPGGSIFLTSTWIFFPSATVAFTDNLSFMGGMSLFPLADDNERFYYFSPKATYRLGPELAVGATAFVLDIGDESMGVAALTSSLGKADAFFSAGIGLGFTDKDRRPLRWSEYPAVMAGTYVQINRNAAYILEGWAVVHDEFDAEDVIIGTGLRFFNQTMAVEMGFHGIRFSEQVGMMPYLSFSFLLNGEE